MIPRAINPQTMIGVFMLTPMPRSPPNVLVEQPLDQHTERDAFAVCGLAPRVPVALGVGYLEVEARCLMRAVRRGVDGDVAGAC